MSPATDLIKRIDSLMQRKRVFVANVGQVPPERHEHVSEDEDIPVLTEVVDINEVTGDSPHQAVHPAADPVSEAITKEFSLRLQERLEAELPQLIGNACQRLAVDIQQTVQRLSNETRLDIASRRGEPSLGLDDQTGENIP